MKHPLSNQEIARLFRYVAAVYVVHGEDTFRLRAYEGAANSIEQLGSPLYELWEEQHLDQVPGLGEKFESYLDELFTTGKVKHFEKEMARVPAGMFPLIDVPGIGPKTAYKLAKRFHLKNPKTALHDLKTHAEMGDIATVPGFTEVSQQKILDALVKEPLEHSGRMLLFSALNIAAEIIALLKKAPAVTHVEALGSIRRRVPTVGDIDLGIATSDPVAVADYLRQSPSILTVTAAGEKQLTIQHRTGLRIDIKLNDPRQWGSLLQHYTGSKLHNIHLRNLAKEKGLSLSEYGIKKGTKLNEYADETAFYGALGLDYIPPELREDTGEIEAATKHVLPTLVALRDIQGDFHTHTNLDFPTSHDMGASSIAAMLEKAEQLGYHYIGLSDHNPKRSNFSASDRLRAVRERNRMIDRQLEAYFGDKKPTMQVFKGLEIDILPSGELALEDEALELLDYAIVSIHSQFDLAAEKTTQRILRALAHPKVKILGHPTGRLLNKREGVRADWEAIFAFCAENDKWLEINASPDRLDLPSDLVRAARAAGAKLVINTDTHHNDHLAFMQLGVWVARRGWAEKKDIVNTSSTSPI